MSTQLHPITMHLMIYPVICLPNQLLFVFLMQEVLSINYPYSSRLSSLQTMT